MSLKRFVSKMSKPFTDGKRSRKNLDFYVTKMGFLLLRTNWQIYLISAVYFKKSWTEAKLRPAEAKSTILSHTIEQPNKRLISKSYLYE